MYWSCCGCGGCDVVTGGFVCRHGLVAVECGDNAADGQNTAQMDGLAGGDVGADFWTMAWWGGAVRVGLL